MSYYNFDKYKRVTNKIMLPKINLLNFKKKDIDKNIFCGSVVGEAVNWIRTLCDTPSNRLTPQIFCECVEQRIKNNKCKLTIMNEAELKRRNMWGVIAVGQGSPNPSRFVVLEYNNKKDDKKPIVFVGKGVTFDAGGISIKSSAHMGEMKNDMTGGAIVAGIFDCVSKLDLPVNIVGLIPLVENMPDGKAYKPGDIIETMSGLTMEIINTDAEGRVILADALFYAKEFNPKYVIDFATLTRAADYVLGYFAAPIMGNNNKLINKIVKAGNKVEERLSQLPIFPELVNLTKSDYADVKNADYECKAGCVMAGAFLSNFVENYKWAHIDIASTSWNNKYNTYSKKGATGFGLRLSIQFLIDSLE
jgi:leucyl aminopeptidase